MSIKTNVNNIEKEVEQIRNTNGDYIDYIYKRVGDTEVEGDNHLDFQSIGGTLKNYRIYGNAVNGENVGDLITEGEHAGEYSVPVTVTNGTNTETTNIYLPEQIKMVGNKAEYVDYKEQKQHFADGTSIDVALPALLTLSGTNTLSVGTEVQPSKVYIKDAFDYKKVFIGMRKIENKTPANYKNIEDNNGTLKNYRIYGNTVNGESVGDKTENLIQDVITGVNISSNGKISDLSDYNVVYAPVVAEESYTISNNNGVNVYAFYAEVPTTETPSSYNGSRQVFNSDSVTFTAPITGYAAVRTASTAQDIMINFGSEALPYEPYGYSVPVTVTNGTNTETTNIYLPEQIKMVGNKAEYVDYKEQKQHFADGTSIDVALPALLTLSGTNTLSVGTEVQPSNIEITGKIKGVE